MLGVDFPGHKFILNQKQNQNLLCYYLPYNFFIGGEDEGIIYLKPGALMRSYSFTCPDLGSSSAEEIAGISNRMNELIKRLGSGWSVHFEVMRKRTKKYPVSEFHTQLGHIIDQRRKELFKSGNPHYENFYFMTFTYNVKADLVSKGSTLLYKKDNSNTDYYNKQNVYKELQFFRDETNELVSHISSNIYITPLNNNEVVTYIKSCLTTEWIKSFAPISPTFFDSFITHEDLKTGECLKIGDKYCPIIALRDFPAETYPAMFDILNHAGIEYRWSTRWIGIDKAASNKLIDKYQKRFNNSRQSWGQAFAAAATGVTTDRYDASAVAFEEETNQAKVMLSKDMISFGYYTCCIEVWDENYDVALDKASYICKLINSTGFGAKIEKTNSFQAWLGMLPGNNYANARKSLLTSGNCSHIIPLSSLWTGNFYNQTTYDMFGNAAPLFVGGSYKSPFYFNLNVGQLFHTAIFGPSRAGKSTWLCLLESQWSKMRKDAQVIVLDKGKTARGVCMGAGGSFVEPGVDGVAFQPLRNIYTEQDVLIAAEFIKCCLEEQHVVVDAYISDDIIATLKQMAETKEPYQRTMTTFQQYAQIKEVKVGILPYTLEGQYGMIFDADNTNFDFSKFTMFEMGTLMNLGEQCVIPALMHIFSLIEKKFAAMNDSNGHPTLLVIDEAWVFLQNKYCAKKIDEWFRTLAKQKVALVIATQDAPSVVESSIISTILANCQTKIFLPDPTATSVIASSAYQTLGLSDSEIYTLSQATMKRDYFYKTVEGARMFQLELDKFQLAGLCPPSVVLDQLERKHGRNSGKELAVEILEMQGFDARTYLKNYKGKVT